MNTNQRLNIPTLRLRDAVIGQSVQLKIPGDERTLQVVSIREDGYYELEHNGRKVVTASPGHEVRKIK